MALKGRISHWYISKEKQIWWISIRQDQYWALISEVKCRQFMSLIALSNSFLFHYMFNNNDSIFAESRKIYWENSLQCPELSAWRLTAGWGIFLGRDQISAYWENNLIPGKEYVLPLSVPKCPTWPQGLWN